MSEIIVPYIYNKEKHLNIDRYVTRDRKLSDASARLFMLLEDFINYNYSTYNLNYTELSYSQIKKYIGYRDHKTTKALKELNEFGYIHIEDVKFRGLPKKRYYIIDKFITVENDINVKNDNIVESNINVENSSNITVENDINVKNDNIVESNINVENSSNITVENDGNVNPESLTHKEPIDHSTTQLVQHKLNNNKQTNSSTTSSTVPEESVCLLKDKEKEEEKRKDNISSNVVIVNGVIVNLLEYIKWNDSYNKKKINNPEAFIRAYHKDPSKFDLSVYVNYIKTQENRKRQEAERLRQKKIQEDRETEKRRIAMERRNNHINSILKGNIGAIKLYELYEEIGKEIGMDLYFSSLDLTSANNDMLKFKANPFVLEKMKDVYLPQLIPKIEERIRRNIDIQVELEV